MFYSALNLLEDAPSFEYLNDLFKDLNLHIKYENIYGDAMPEFTIKK